MFGTYLPKATTGKYCGFTCLYKTSVLLALRWIMSTPQLHDCCDVTVFNKCPGDAPAATSLAQVLLQSSVFVNVLTLTYNDV